MMQAIAGIDVSRETIADLEAFAALTTKWTPKINLIAKSTVDNIWERHIVDSAQLYRFAPESFTTWADLGSGGGFPGIVMAIIAKQKQPTATFHLVESDQRKATFLRTVVRELNLSATVHANRIDEVSPLSADVVSARALTALSGLLGFAHLHIKPDGLCLLHKGRSVQQEIADATKNWRFDLEDHASITDPEARLLAIQRISACAQ